MLDFQPDFHGLNYYNILAYGIGAYVLGSALGWAIRQSRGCLRSGEAWVGRTTASSPEVMARGWRNRGQLLSHGLASGGGAAGSPAQRRTARH